MIFVPGIPLPAGSGDRFMTRIAGRVCWTGPYVDMSDRKTKKRKSGGLKRWKTAIAEHARMTRCEVIDGPVAMEIMFVFPRPLTHVKKSGGLRKGKPYRPIALADIDKLSRAVLDALPDIVYANDSQVCSLSAKKRYTLGSEQPGVQIAWRAMEEQS